MNDSASSLKAAGMEEIAELRERIRTLELRLDRIEQDGPAAVPRAAQTPATATPASAAPSEIDTEMAAATIFTRIAMLCFVLLGALILRVLTQQNILGAGFGTILGFTYAGHLIVLSIIPGRFGKAARENSVFQCSGAVLSFIIAIESVMRTQTIGRVPAMIAIAGFALLALGMGIHHRKAALAGTGILCGILALVALDMKEGTVALQLGLVTLLASAGIANSWREGWQWLRPLTTLMMFLLLPGGFFFCGKAPVIAGGLLAASIAFWLAAMLQHLLAFRRLDRAAAWLPLLTLWLAGIQQVAHWQFIGATNGAIAAFALVCVIVCTRRAPEAAAGLAGLMATAALAGAIGGALLDPTGLLCALGGLALWQAGRRNAADWAAACATLLMLAAAVVGLAQLLRPPVPAFGLIAMSLSAVVLVLHYVRNGRTGTAPYFGLAMRLAPVALAAGLALLLGLFWDLLNHLFGQPTQLLLSQTVAVVITALALTFWGHASHRRSALICGLACMALALAKVLLVDLMQLKSFNMLASLVLVGLASVAVSVILRRRS
jgi:hypothetical protein